MVRLLALLVVLCCLVASTGHAYTPTPPPASPPCLWVSVVAIDNPTFGDASVAIHVGQNTGPTYVCIAGNTRYGGFVNKRFLLGPADLVQCTSPPVYRFVFEELDSLTWYTVYAYDQYHGVRSEPFFIGF